MGGGTGMGWLMIPWLVIIAYRILANRCNDLIKWIDRWH